MSFFRPNISMAGRIVRGITALVMLAVSAYVWSKPDGPWLAVPLLLGGLFVMFEAVRGWCIVRACGWRTFI